MSHRIPSRSVSLLHVCPLAAVGSIRRSGLDPAFSRGVLSVCWLVSPGRRRWAVAHVLARHACAAVCVLRFRVPRAWLSRRGRGIWCCPRLVPPSCLVSLSLPAFAAAAA